MTGLPLLFAKTLLADRPTLEHAQGEEEAEEAPLDLLLVCA